MSKITDVGAAYSPQFERVESRIEQLERELLAEKEWVRQLTNSNARLEKFLSNARKDAVRYRWMRERHENTIMDIYNSISPAMKPELLDAAIDAAIRKGE